MGYFCNQGIPNIKEKMFSSFLGQKKSQRLPYPILRASVEIGKGKHWKIKKIIFQSVFLTYKKTLKNHYMWTFKISMIYKQEIEVPIWGPGLYLGVG